MCPQYSTRASIAKGTEKSSQRTGVPTVFSISVLNYLFAPLMLEVDIDVGRLTAFFADEALKEHVAASGVHLRDAKAVAHGGVGRRASALTEDVLTASKAHDIVHSEKVRLVFQVGYIRRESQTA
jgi:hypothetical protein